MVLDPSIPVTDVTAGVNSLAAGYFQSIDLFGRSANVTAALPYSWVRWRGRSRKHAARITRSGLADLRLRLGVNLFGARAFRPREVAQNVQKTNVGVSFTLSIPTGQYDPAKLINLGTNRWTFRPEVGISYSHKQLLLEGALGAWIFGDNDQFFGNSLRKQEAVTTVQGMSSTDCP